MPELSYREAIRDGLAQAMRADEDVFLMGEDIAEMGGSMGVTQGLLDEFGPERVRNTPISEMALAGAAIGAALQGMRPIAEIMYEDFMTLASEQVVNQAAKIRYMSGGQTSVPVVFRTQGGAGWSPGAQHAQALGGRGDGVGLEPAADAVAAALQPPPAPDDADRRGDDEVDDDQDEVRQAHVRVHDAVRLRQREHGEAEHDRRADEVRADDGGHHQAPHAGAELDAGQRRVADEPRTLRHLVEPALQPPRHGRHDSRTAPGRRRHGRIRRRVGQNAVLQ